ncbi:hypothetical protein ADL06_18575 [Streptomyces sp. NRRL F-6491]|nr:hypothetical protein ADL06_18575 [Streptomyces sp. NRRL F-6491]KOX41430.1 hypothetical protein ADL08_18820 [Streptomyces sp. NRRL F-6492]
MLPPGGLVLIVEPVLPEVVDTGADNDVLDGGTTCLGDLDILVNVGGRERTRKEFEEVCRRAGLSLTSVTPLTEAAPFSLIEAEAETAAKVTADRRQTACAQAPFDHSAATPQG